MAAEEASQTSAKGTSSVRNISVSIDRWLTHFPVIAKCNIFNGHNLILWERTIQAALKPRKLIHHLSEDCPLEDHHNFQKWVMEVEFVFAWLLDSIAPKQVACLISYDTSRKLWEAIKRSHSKQGDKAKIIDMIIKSYTLKQEDGDILTYSNKLRDIRTELDHCYPQSTDLVARAREATNRLCQLLKGLRPEFEMVRSQLYNREEEPTFDEAVTKLMQEESRLQALKGAIEGNAYFTKGQRNTGQLQGQYPRSELEKGNRNDLACNYCKRTRHTKDKCLKLHGLPPHMAKVHLVQNSQQGVHNSNAEGISSAQDFQRMIQELQSIKTMINSSITIIGSTLVANSGYNEFLNNLSLFTKDLTNAWILDYGATNHMTPLSDFESSETIAPGKHVQTADDILLQVVDIGHTNIQPIGKMTNVLHVPKLCVSIISV